MNLYIVHYRRPFAFCYFLCPLHRGHRLRFGCRRHPYGVRRRCMGFTSFPSVSARLASRAMGLGTFYPPHVLGNPLQCMTSSGLRDAFWLQLLDLHQETSVSCSIITTVQSNVHMCFPYPLTSAFVDCLVQSIGRSSQIACAQKACGLHAECLTAAPHPAITRDARAVEVTPFRKWFRFK